MPNRPFRNIQDFNTPNMLIGIGVGAAMTYFLDPRQRRRRSARIRDRLIHYTHTVPGSVSVIGRDLAHRTQGTVAQLRSRMTREEDVSDDVIEDRVRAKIGRVVSHPHAIDVNSDDGIVTLRGLILAHEHRSLLDSISRVRGVRRIDNRLQAHRRDEKIPSLQGGIPRPGERIDLLQTHWAPATRLIMGLTGGSLGTYGLYRRDVIGLGLGVVGLLTLARSVTNLEFKRLLGIRGRRAIQFHKTIHIQAPIEKVFDFWSRFENFPKVLREVSNVRIVGDRRSRWTVKGPLGAPVSFEAETTAYLPNQLVEWRSVPGSLIRNAGLVKFFPSEKGGTKIELCFTYNPPAGILGHNLAKLFGSDPKRRIEESLSQMKQLIEQPSLRQTRAIG